MKNLKRYDPCNERMGRALVPGMTENKGGMYVKFSDIKDILNSTPNKAKVQICPDCGGEVCINKHSGRGFCVSCDYTVSGKL